MNARMAVIRPLSVWVSFKQLPFCHPADVSAFSTVVDPIFLHHSRILFHGGIICILHPLSKGGGIVVFLKAV